MKIISTWGVAAVLALCSASAGAQSGATGWELRGQIDGLSDPSGDIDIAIGVGSPFRVIVNYDTRTGFPQIFPEGGGTQYRNLSAPGVSAVVYLGGFGPFILSSQSGQIRVRDRVLFTEFPGAPSNVIDGYSFAAQIVENGVTTQVGVIIRGTDDSIVNTSNLLPFTPPGYLLNPANLVGLTAKQFNVCRFDSGGSVNNCNRGGITGVITSIAVPTFGTNWFLSARDCKATEAQTEAAGAPSPYDCIQSFQDPATGQYFPTRFGRFADNYAGLGIFGFDTKEFRPVSDIAGPSFGQALGTVRGKVTFDEVAALPILRAGSYPTDISRTNSNLLGFQLYDYTGPATPLPIIAELTFDMQDNSVDTSIAETGLRPGGATLGAVLSILDGSKVVVPQLANMPFNSLFCGNEANVGLPAGAILGSADYASPDGTKNPSARAVLDVRSCADPSSPVQLQANQKFIVASSLQTPARGSWTLNATKPPAGGYVNAENTLRVTFDPAAPPNVVQNLVQNIVPACSDCGGIKAIVDVRPGDTGCINPRLRGVIPAAFLGSAVLDVSNIRVDETLKLGTLSPRRLEGKPLCSRSDINADGYMDLVCHFENQASAWISGQTTVTLSGVLGSGLAVSGADAICVK